MEIIVHIPDDLAGRLGSAGEIERCALAALALEEYKLGHLTRPELRRLLGFGTREALDGFLRAHRGSRLDQAARKPAEPAGETAPDEARRARARQAVTDIMARGKGVTLAGLKIKDLIDEGRK